MFAGAARQRPSCQSQSLGRVADPVRRASGPIVGHSLKVGSSASPSRCACGGSCPRCSASTSATLDTSTAAAQGRGGGDATPTGAPTPHEVFCHSCPAKKTVNVAIYSQWSSDFRESNITFAKVMGMNHNFNLDIQHAGVIPSLYDADKKKYGKVETVADLCDIVKMLEDRNDLPPASGFPAMFLPFGKQLQGDAADTVGWHIPNINTQCEPHVGKRKTTKLLLVDSSPDVKSCSSVLLHEVGHAVGNADVSGSRMVMGPCDPSAKQDPPIGCNPDTDSKVMTAIEVKKFCAAGS